MKQHFDWTEQTDQELATEVENCRMGAVEAIGQARLQGRLAMRDEINRNSRAVKESEIAKEAPKRSLFNRVKKGLWR